MIDRVSRSGIVGTLVCSTWLFYILGGQSTAAPPAARAEGPPRRPQQPPLGVPDALRRVGAEWDVDDEGRIVGVDFASRDGVLGPEPTLAQFRGVAELPALRRLHGPAQIFTEEWLDVVGRLGGLRELELYDPKVTDEGTVALRNLKELRRLQIRQADISDITAVRIASLDKLEELDLRDTNITDLGIKQLVALKKLSVLRIGNNATPQLISPKSVPDLCKIKSLRALDLDSTGHLDRDVEDLKRCLPDCYIITH